MADVTSTTGVLSSRSIDQQNQSPNDGSQKSKIISTTPKHPAAVARRNARERNRVRQVNMGFVTLRNHIPQHASKSKKLSKVETLRQAANYIRYLRDMLSIDDSIHPPFNVGNGGDHCADSIDPNSNFFFPPPSASFGTPSDASYTPNSSLYTPANFEPIAQQHKTAHYVSTTSHLKISPSSSTDSPQSANSFISSTSSTSSEITNAKYECVSPPQLARYSMPHTEFMEHNQNNMTPYHRLSQNTHSMQMYS